MKGCLIVFAVLVGLFAGGLGLPMWLIDNGVEDFGNRGDPERRGAARAFFYVATYYGESFLDYGDYIGPPLVLGWRVEDVEGCPPLPSGEEPEEDGYRAYAGVSAEIGAYTLFGIPRGEVEVTCGGRREWKPYF
jgi:hypothetical protein